MAAALLYGVLALGWLAAFSLKAVGGEWLAAAASIALAVGLACNATSARAIESERLASAASSWAAPASDLRPSGQWS
jgi:hypothetical protein